MQNPQLKKHIGFYTLIGIGVGSMIGSGIFALPAAMAAVAGPGLILSIFLAGIFTLFLALSYAELGSAFPITGGPYAYPKMTMGNLCGFLMGWGYYLYLFIGTAAIIDIFIVYLGFYFPGLANGQVLTPLGVSIGVIFLWIVTFINILGVRWGGLYSLVTTIGKLVSLLLFGLLGSVLISKKNFTPFLPFSFTGVTLGMTIFFWSYTGFETMVIPCDEVKNPRRTIPLSMFITMFITIITYVFIAFVFVGIINWKDLGLSPFDWKGLERIPSPLSTVASVRGFPIMAGIAMIGALIATAGAGGNWVLIQGRMPYAMAKDHMFPPFFRKIFPTFGTPALSILMSSLFTTIIMIVIPDFPAVSLIASVTAIVPYAGAMLSVPILRYTSPKTQRHFKLPFHFAWTLIGFVLSTWLIYWATWPWTLIGVVLILISYPLYLFTGKKIQFFRTLWLVVYLIGVCVISLIGDPAFEFNNFLDIRPLGLLPMPIDLIILAIFAIVIYIWAYNVNKKYPINPSL